MRWLRIVAFGLIVMIACALTLLAIRVIWLARTGDIVVAH